MSTVHKFVFSVKHLHNDINGRYSTVSSILNCITIHYYVFYFRMATENIRMYRNIDQTLVNSLHGLLNCEIGGLDYRTRVHCIHM